MMVFHATMRAKTYVSNSKYEMLIGASQLWAQGIVIMGRLAPLPWAWIGGGLAPLLRLLVPSTLLGLGRQQLQDLADILLH